MGAPTRVAFAGASGKTGSAVANGLHKLSELEIVTCVSRSGDIPTALGSDYSGELVASLADVTVDVDVLVDFTTATASQRHMAWAVDHGVHVVLGTTGVPDNTLTALGDRFAAAQLGLLFAPNFAISAVLAMQFAEQAAHYFPTVEIVEAHNPAKLDAPSGTAKLTAQRITRAHSASGARIAEIPIHSMRLAGAVAHQAIVFGSEGQLLTIKTDATDRRCYVAGVAQAVARVTSLRGLVMGLENVL